MTGILAWLLGSALGRKVAAGLLIAALLALAIARIYAAGRTAEQARQTAAQLRNLKTRMEVDNDIASLSRDQRRARLARWMRD